MMLSSRMGFRLVDQVPEARRPSGSGPISFLVSASMPSEMNSTSS